MEIVIVLFLGVWLSSASAIAYLKLKNDYKEVLEEERR